ncbi:MAG: hypothetical protein EOO15_01580 [Chitinophagaceae bacterium]|nr:MAG: hypothetical protein EOO15_01580 [Chitinophagaceae bacterium]
MTSTQLLQIKTITLESSPDSIVILKLISAQEGNISTNNVPDSFFQVQEFKVRLVTRPCSSYGDARIVSENIDSCFTKEGRFYYRSGQSVRVFPSTNIFYRGDAVYYYRYLNEGLESALVGYKKSIAGINGFKRLLKED